MAKTRSASMVVKTGEDIEAVLKQVRQLGARIPQPQSVADYLKQHTELLSVIAPVVEIAKQRLPEAVLSLELYTDPEIDDEYLTLYARFYRYNPSIMERIDTVCAEYEPLLASTHGWLLLTTDFRLPE